MSSQPQTAASAASFAANVPLREPCVAFASPAVQAFLARGDRMAAIKPEWLTDGRAAAASQRLREVELPALADPTLEAIEELGTPVAATMPAGPTVEDILFAPIDASTLDASMIGGACAFRGDDDATVTSGDAAAWSESVCPAACMVAASGVTVTTNGPQAVAEGNANDDDTLLLVEVDGDDATTAANSDDDVTVETTAATTTDAEQLPTLELVDDATTAANSGDDVTVEMTAATTTDAEQLPTLELVDDATTAANSDDDVTVETTAATTTDAEELPTLELVDDATTAANSGDELPALERVSAATATAAQAVAEELESLGASAAEAGPAAVTPFLDDGVTPDDLLVAASADGEPAASAATDPSWQPGNDGDVALLEPTHGDDLSPTTPTATEWSPETDVAAAVAVAEPVAAPTTTEQAVSAPAAVPAAAQAVGSSETTTPPAIRPATTSRIDSDLEQVQHHMLTALEHVQTNLTAALEQLRAVTPPDVTPALTELRTELGRQGELLAANVVAVKQLDDRVVGLGDAVQQAGNANARQVAAPAPMPAAVDPVSLRAPLAVAALGATWSVLLWWKTGSTALAAGTLVAANLVAGLWLGRGRG